MKRVGVVRLPPYYLIQLDDVDDDLCGPCSCDVGDIWILLLISMVGLGGCKCNNDTQHKRIGIIFSQPFLIWVFTFFFFGRLFLYYWMTRDLSQVFCSV